MIKRSASAFRRIINKNPLLKKRLLWIYDTLFRYLPFIVGAFTRFPSYLKNRINSKVIAGPGLLSFGAVFNPGALLTGDFILLLANAQKVPWFKARENKREFYMQGNPLLIWVDRKTGTIVDRQVITKIQGLPNERDYAVEDFRLFWWQGKKIINHSLVTRRKIDGFIGQAGSVSALSVVDDKDRSFRFMAVPTLDVPLQTFEKNWVFKQNGAQLLLFYSVSPFRVLELSNASTFFFRTIINEKLSSKMNDPGGFGSRVSFSTNPINFSENYWLLVIHQIDHQFTGRCYFHWAVLIEKSTFLPVKITSRSIFSGMGARGRLPGIRYISSIVKVDQEILFFAGEGDVCVTCTKMKVLELNKLFINIY